MTDRPTVTLLQGTLTSMGEYDLAVVGLLWDQDAVRGAVIFIGDNGGEEHDVEVGLGDTFPAGQALWRLDSAKAYDDVPDLIGASAFEAVLTRVG